MKTGIREKIIAPGKKKLPNFHSVYCSVSLKPFEMLEADHLAFSHLHASPLVLSLVLSVQASHRSPYQPWLCSFQLPPPLCVTECHSWEGGWCATKDSPLLFTYWSHTFWHFLFNDDPNSYFYHVFCGQIFGHFLRRKREKSIVNPNQA